ncbi:MAG: O-methyltransferase [Desulfobacterales bacterium]|nr:O-methyltransferase [Desulfobacterales bacterium]
MPNVIVPNPESYFRQFVPSQQGVLKTIEKEAAQEFIPIIGPVVGTLLNILAITSGAKRILEIGTAIGYSGIFFAEACKITDGKLTTIEMNPAHADRAADNFKKSGLSDFTEVLNGDARDILNGMAESFDMVFLDIDKVTYIDLLEPCHKILKNNGLMITDNVAFKESDEFNQALKAHTGFRSVPLYAFLPDHSPEYDGLSFALKRES